ncbi:hypothetical protein AAH978_12265 [Streptomyces sp. ZYX-F-203]
MTTRRLPALLSLLALGTLLAGCGIRATEVPTEYGPAPSRARCASTPSDSRSESAGGVPVRVFLLCGSSLVAVDRTVRTPGGSEDSRRVLAAQALLDELATPPSAAEQEAGYTSDVRETTVGGPRRGDPADTLRLGTSPEDLTSYALAQIVCTFSDSAAAEDEGSVVLGGPGTEEPLRYTCTDEVRARPGGNEPPSGRVTGG